VCTASALGNRLNPSRYRIVEARGLDLREDLDLIKAEIEDFKPDIVRLDSWRSLWSGNENYSEEAGPCLYPLAALCHDYDIALLLVHHMALEGKRGRGSGAIEAAADMVLTLTIHDEKNPSVSVLRNPECRFDANPPDRYLSLETADDGTLVFEGADKPLAAEAETAELLLAALHEHGPLKSGPLSDVVDIKGSRFDKGRKYALAYGLMTQPGGERTAYHAAVVPA
jgi:hypothetical protein